LTILGAHFSDLNRTRENAAHAILTTTRRGEAWAKNLLSLTQFSLKTNTTDLSHTLTRHKGPLKKCGCIFGVLTDIFKCDEVIENVYAEGNFV